MKTVFMMRSQVDGPVTHCFILEGLVEEVHRDQVEYAAAMAGLSTECLFVSEHASLKDVLRELANLADE